MNISPYSQVLPRHRRRRYSIALHVDAEAATRVEQEWWYGACMRRHQ